MQRRRESQLSGADAARMLYAMAFSRLTGEVECSAASLQRFAVSLDALEVSQARFQEWDRAYRERRLRLIQSATAATLPTQTTALLAGLIAELPRHYLPEFRGALTQEVFQLIRLTWPFERAANSMQMPASLVDLMAWVQELLEQGDANGPADQMALCLLNYLSSGVLSLGFLDAPKIAPGDLSKAQAEAIYRALRLPRLIEERGLTLLRQGKISKWFSAWGQEAISVGAALALEPEDFMLTMHRNLGVFTQRLVLSDGSHALSNLCRLFKQLMGKEGGFTKGRDRSYHFGTSGIELSA
ncbi:MAG: thiamine pyrophosphate-dependent enzyme [Myxococcota bacterium]